MSNVKVNGSPYNEKYVKDAARANVKHQILNLLGWNELQYGEFQEEMGIAYLEHEFGAHFPMRDEILKEVVFWSWWKLHWLKRDFDFINTTFLLRRDEMESYYRDVHDPMAVPFKPHRVVLQQTYDSMMHRLVKSSVKLENDNKVLDQLKYTVMADYGIDEELFFGTKEPGRQARMLCMYIALQYSKVDPKAVVKYFGKERTAEYYINRVVSDWLTVDRLLQAKFKRILKTLKYECETE